MSEQAETLVVRAADIAPAVGGDGWTASPINWARPDWNERTMICALITIASNGRWPLGSPPEQMLTVLAGTGEFRTGETAFEFGPGDFLLKPASAGYRAEIQNKGDTELKIISFSSQSKTINLNGRDRARAAIDRFIEKRRPAVLNWESFAFDGRVLSITSKSFRAVITYDEFGTIYLNGDPIQYGDNQDANALAEKLLEAERELRNASEKIG